MAPKNEQLTAAEKAEIMGDGFSPAREQEAQERYGHTDVGLNTNAALRL